MGGARVGCIKSSPDTDPLYGKIATPHMGLSFRKATYLKKCLLARLTGRTNLHFLHIRKTGGTALKNALRAHPVTENCVLHLHPHRIRLSDVPVGHRVMLATRDPVSRFVSGFGSRLRQGGTGEFCSVESGRGTGIPAFSHAQRAGHGVGAVASATRGGV